VRIPAGRLKPPATQCRRAHPGRAAEAAGDADKARLRGLKPPNDATRRAHPGRAAEAAGYRHKARLRGLEAAQRRSAG
jgi:hypothetical protein